MNDYELVEMKKQVMRLDEMMKLLAAKECSCIACLLKGCDCCENKGDVDKLIEKYQTTQKALKQDIEYKEQKEERKKHKEY